MADTPDNVVPLVSESDPGGVRNARARRNKQQPKKSRASKAKPYLSAPAETAVHTENTAADAVVHEPKKDSQFNDVSYGREATANAVTEHDRLDVRRDEFRPLRRGGGGGNSGSGSTSHHTALDVLAIMTAIGLAGITAWLSINGMVVLFPGLPVIALMLGVAIEGAKVTTSAWLGRHWLDASWLSRVALIWFTCMCATLNAASVYSQLVAAHVGPQGMATAARDTSDADVAGRIEVAQGRVADIDKRIAQIDATIAEATRRGRTRDAMRLVEDQRRARGGLASERDQAARELAGLKTRRVETSAQGRAAEVESTPLRYLAEILNINAGPEALIRFLIAAIVACGDPFAIALLAAVSGRRRWS